MRTPARLTPHVALGILTVLAVGAVVLSLVQAPPVADTLLRAAAGNTAGASSLVWDASEGVLVDGHVAVLERAREEVEPGRLSMDLALEAGEGLRIVLVGHRVYVLQDGAWYSEPEPPGVATYFSAPRNLPRLLSRVSGAATSRGQTRFTAWLPAATLARKLYLSLPVGPGRVKVRAGVTGEFLTSFSARFAIAAGGVRRTFLITERYSHIDALPPLRAPAAAHPLSPPAP